MLPTVRTRETPPQRFSPARPEASSCSRTLREKCSGWRLPRLGSAPPSGRGVRWRRRLPVSSAHGSGRAGGDSALRLPPSSFPSPAQGGRRPLLPPLLQQPTSNRPLGATAQAPATRRGKRSASGADNCRHHRAAQAQGPAFRRSLDFFFPLFLPPPQKDWLRTWSSSATLNTRGHCKSGVPGVWLGQRQLLIGSEGVHAPSPARAEPEQPIRARTDGNDPILETG